VFVAVSQFEQRANNKFFCKLGKSATGILVGPSAIYGDKVQLLHKHLTELLSFFTALFFSTNKLASSKPQS
jgi:hypothetical protein